MNERKWQSLIEKQVQEAQERGDFDHLPGKGKPIPGLDRPHDELWWLKSMLKREGLEFLPAGLAARRDVEALLAKIERATTEPAVRRLVGEANEIIAKANATQTSGPSSGLAPLNADRVVAEWRARQG